MCYWVACTRDDEGWGGGEWEGEGAARPKFSILFFQELIKYSKNVRSGKK